MISTLVYLTGIRWGETGVDEDQLQLLYKRRGDGVCGGGRPLHGQVWAPVFATLQLQLENWRVVLRSGRRIHGQSPELDEAENRGTGRRAMLKQVQGLHDASKAFGRCVAGSLLFPGNTTSRRNRSPASEFYLLKTGTLSSGFPYFQVEIQGRLPIT